MLKLDVISKMSAEELADVVEDVEQAIRVVSQVMVDRSSTPTNRLKAVEAKFNLLEARVILKAGGVSNHAKSLGLLQRKVTVLSQALAKYDPDLVERVQRMGE